MNLGIKQNWHKGFAEIYSLLLENLLNRNQFFSAKIFS